MFQSIECEGTAAVRGRLLLQDKEYEGTAALSLRSCSCIDHQAHVHHSGVQHSDIELANAARRLKYLVGTLRAFEAPLHE